MSESGCSIEHGLVLHLEIGCLLLRIALMALRGLTLNLISEWCDSLIASICHFLVVLKDEVDRLVHLRLGPRVVPELNGRY